MRRTIHGSSLYVLGAVNLLVLGACGLDTNLSSGSDAADASFPDTAEGRGARRALLDRASVDGGTVPQGIGELIAGPATRKICRSRAGDSVSCQPQYLGTGEGGRPIIRFAELECDFIRPTDPEFKPLSGRTEKFLCLARDEQGRPRAVKIKYKSEEVFAEVAATRLLSSFGFAVDTMQPLAVLCKGCPEDPFASLSAKNPTWPDRNSRKEFWFAALEDKFDGEKINIEDAAGREVLEGFTFPELMEGLAKSPLLTEGQKDRREALAFLNAFLYNLDTKSSNQRLSCTSLDNGVCTAAVAISQDLGFTFGSHPTRAKKLNLEGWRGLPVWKNAERCDASQHLKLGPVELGVSIGLSESGRKEVSRLFAGLTRDKLLAIFETARFGIAGMSFAVASQQWPTASAFDTTQAWVSAFEERIAQFKTVTRCPERPSAAAALP